MQDNCSSEKPRYYKTVHDPTHPLAKVGGYVYVHEVVLYAKIGKGPHLCHWGGEVVDWKQTIPQKMDGVLCSDHLNQDITDNRPENLVPSCFRHNISRTHPQNFLAGEDWMQRGSQRLRYHLRICVGCGAEFKAANFIKTSKDHVGKYCSIKCYRKAIAVPDNEPFLIRKDGFRQRAVELSCPECGDIFLRPKSCLNRKGLKFCSRACNAGHYAKMKPREFFQKIRGSRSHWGPPRQRR
jgi:hypothetical protein